MSCLVRNVMLWLVSYLGWCWCRARQPLDLRPARLNHVNPQFDAETHGKETLFCLCEGWTPQHPLQSWFGWNTVKKIKWFDRSTLLHHKSEDFSDTPNTISSCLVVIISSLPHWTAPKNATNTRVTRHPSWTRHDLRVAVSRLPSGPPCSSWPR